MTHIDRWTVEPPKFPTRELHISSTAQRALIPPRQINRPLICDCGKRAGHFLDNHYFCQACKVIIRCHPNIGRIEFTLEQWTREHPAINAEDFEASAQLEPLNPEIY